MTSSVSSVRLTVAHHTLFLGSGMHMDMRKHTDPPLNPSFLSSYATAQSGLLVPLEFEQSRTIMYRTATSCRGMRFSAKSDFGCRVKVVAYLSLNISIRFAHTSIENDKIQDRTIYMKTI